MVLVGVEKLAKISVRGVVQGVGFRPFVYRLATQHNLRGWVRNTSGNVEIEVEGDEEVLANFQRELELKAPLMARIEHIDSTLHPLKGYRQFEIQKSLSQKGKYQLISPDIAACYDCQREIFSPTDRRFRYPFTNCTNCGPRFTIIEDIPYDRPSTTMRSFQMCQQCQQEYNDPLDRRFHAQPNACPECGPSLELVDSNSKPVKGDPIEEASRLLKEGKIVALKGLGGFHLACDATNEKAINLLRSRKRRQNKPLAVMMSTSGDIEKHCELSPEERKLLKSPECPIVLLRWKRDSSSISPAVAPNLKYLGVMLPYTPLYHIMLSEIGIPLVMTSGNISEEPIAKDNDEALRRLSGIADYFLLHNRDIYSRYDDSVYIVENGKSQAIRRARGYAPYPIFLPFKARQILACGAEEKNTFCLTKDEHAFISQHIGDMENEETLDHFENTIGLYKRLFRIEPEIVAHDMHPEYLSTKYAQQVGTEQGLRLVPVQHHHAHIVSCLVENKIKGPAIGVAFDGTGYGADGTIWGGEFLIADWHSFQRAGHLERVPIPGGAAAIKKPSRMALSYLHTLLGANFPLEELPIKPKPVELAIIEQQLKQKINSPLTSSAGRLFDTVSALTGVRQEIDYEAQAAIELEMIASEETGDIGAYPFSIIEQEGIKIMKLNELFLALIQDIKIRVPAPLISLKFHNTVAQMIGQMCKSIAKQTGINLVALSGGVFQNRLLLKLAITALQREGLEVLTHHLVPCNDSGISLGQAVIANLTVE